MNCIICEQPMTASDHRLEWRCTKKDCVAENLLQMAFDPNPDPEPASTVTIAPTPAFWAGKGILDPVDDQKEA